MGKPALHVPSDSRSGLLGDDKQRGAKWDFWDVAGKDWLLVCDVRRCGCARNGSVPRNVVLEDVVGVRIPEEILKRLAQ